LKNYQALTGQVDNEGNKLTTNSESDGRYHSNWMNMMYPRLRLARNLLKHDGVIFMSIDDNEVENLRKICDELYGESNFVGNLILQTATDNNPTQINTEHEYILCYAKASRKLKKWFAPSKAAESIITHYNLLKEQHGDDIDEIQKALRAWIKKNKSNLPKFTHYDNVDEKGVFHDGDIANTRFGGYEYEVLHPKTGKPCKVPEKGFRYPKDTMNRLIEEGNILFGDDETTLIKPKKRVEDAKDMLRTMIYEDGRASTKVVDNLLDRGVFDNPKSTTILSRLMGFVLEENDIVLDFFSGSGSTAHASFNFQLENSGVRVSNIQVQLPENLESSLEYADAKTKKTLQKAIKFLDSIDKKPLLTEIGKERIRRAASKIQEDSPNDAEDLDLGFKVFKLDTSNIKPWEGSTEDIEQSLFEAEENIKEGRTAEDVLYEVLLKYGLDLTLPIEEKELDGQKVFNVGQGALFLCLDEKIKASVAEAIGKWKKEVDPEICRVIFRDSGFTDVDKTNATQTLKKFGITEVKSI
jgi:adenine-specific DNA-methyltransferase